MVGWIVSSVALTPTTILTHGDQNGEVVVALENLCDNLFELDVQLPTAARRVLVEACESASVNARYWEHFKTET